MAQAIEVAFYQAVMAAESVRQSAYASAFATYAYNPSNLATYQAALVTADVAFEASVNSAATTAGIISPMTLDGGLSRSLGPSISATIIS